MLVWQKTADQIYRRCLILRPPVVIAHPQTPRLKMLIVQMTLLEAVIHLLMGHLLLAIFLQLTGERMSLRSRPSKSTGVLKMLRVLRLLLVGSGLLPRWKRYWTG
jgi:hypothetical protein